MAETTYNTDSDVRRTASKAADTVSNKASQAADSVSNMASQAADSVSSMASDLRQKAVSKLSDTASYFRENDVQAMTSDLKGWVKANPTQALVGALAVGFLAGALLRRR